MRDLRLLDAHRLTGPEVDRLYGNSGDSTYGVFLVPSPVVNGPLLRIIAASAEGWDHVSVSTESRPPTWAEMELVRRMFFRDDETAMQLHVPPQTIREMTWREQLRSDLGNWLVRFRRRLPYLVWWGGEVDVVVVLKGSGCATGPRPRRPSGRSRPARSPRWRPASASSASSSTRASVS